MGNKHLGERWFLMDHADNSRFFHLHDDGFHDRRDRCYPLLLPGKTSFTEEVVRSQNCDDGFLALLRNDGRTFAKGARRSRSRAFVRPAWREYSGTGRRFR
jgi:hypothetical protein